MANFTRALSMLDLNPVEVGPTIISPKKDHFLENDEQFLMVFFEYNRNKLIIIDKHTIKRYNTINKWFKAKDCYDWVKEMKMSDGHIFGTNITDVEKRNFK